MLKNSRIFATTTVPSSGSRGHNCCCGFTENPLEKKKKGRKKEILQNFSNAHALTLAARTFSLFTRKTPVAIHFSRHIFFVTLFFQPPASPLPEHHFHFE